MQKILFFILLLFVFIDVFGKISPPDSILFAKNDTIRPYDIGNLDTNVYFFDDYYPQKQISPYLLDAGFLGTPVKSILFFNPESSLSYIPTIDGYCAYFELPREFDFYIKEPYFSELFWVNGGKENQFFRATYYQNYKERIKINLKYQVSNLGDTYFNQNLKHKNLALSVSYLSPNTRYYIKADYDLYSGDIHENGGVKKQSSIKDTIDHRLLIEPNIFSANRIIKHHSINLNQKVLLTKPVVLQVDTNSVDSIAIDSASFPKEKTNFSVTHDLQIKLLKSNYLDTDDTNGYYFNNLYFDNISNNDTLGNIAITNKLGVELAKDSIMIFTSKIAHNYISTYYNEKDDFYNNLVLENTALYFDKAVWSATLNYCFNGYNKQAFALNFGWQDSIGSGKYLLTLKTGVKSNMPSLFYNNFDSDIMGWHLDLEPIRTHFVLSKLSINQNHSLFLGMQSTYKHTYLSENLLPTQYNKQLYNGFLGLDNLFLFFNKHFVFQHSSLVQFSSQSDVLSLPTFYSNSSLSYSFGIFKKKMHINIGVRCIFHTLYYSDGFVPFLGSYYAQNHTQTGNYPFLDGFAKIKIKRARIFLKYEHINANYSGYNYFYIPYYPAKDRILKIGVSWLFFD